MGIIVSVFDKCSDLTQTKGLSRARIFGGLFTPGVLLLISGFAVAVMRVARPRDHELAQQVDICIEPINMKQLHSFPLVVVMKNFVAFSMIFTMAHPFTSAGLLLYATGQQPFPVLTEKWHLEKTLEHPIIADCSEDDTIQTGNGTYFNLNGAWRVNWTERVKLVNDDMTDISFFKAPVYHFNNGSSLPCNFSTPVFAVCPIKVDSDMEVCESWANTSIMYSSIDWMRKVSASNVSWAKDLTTFVDYDSFYEYDSPSWDSVNDYVEHIDTEREDLKDKTVNEWLVITIVVFFVSIILCIARWMHKLKAAANQKVVEDEERASLVKNASPGVGGFGINGSTNQIPFTNASLNDDPTRDTRSGSRISNSSRFMYDPAGREGRAESRFSASGRMTPDPEGSLSGSDNRPRGTSRVSNGGEYRVKRKSIIA